MDDRRFDDLTRSMASGMTRRGVLRVLGRGLAGFVAGAAAVRSAPTAAQEGLRLDILACLGLTPKLAAQVCIALNLPHVAKTGCVNGRCAILACQAGWANCDGQVQTGCETPLGTHSNCAACGDSCARLDDACHAGACAGGTCAAQPANVGGTCDDGNPCTVADTCQPNGACAGMPTDCSGQNDPCNTGVCRSIDGACIKQPVSNGTACSADSNACTVNDSCQNGICTPGPLTDCSALSDPCNDGVCDPATGACGKRPKANGTICDDGNACTVGDVCTDGVCAGTLKDCSAQDDPCNDGVCRAADGACIKRPIPDGNACNADNDSCTVGDSCQNGVCTPGTGTNCDAVADQCNDGVCDPATGTCQRRPKRNGTGCNADSNACTVGDACLDGACVAGSAMSCPPCQACVGGACAPSAGDPRCTTVCCGETCCAAGEECVGNQCQAATCTPGCPRCQSCIDGACQPVASDSRCGTLCCDGLCCAPESECVGNICQPICRPLGAACAGAGACCPSEFEDVDCQTVCNSFTTCCHFAGGSCSEDCDCCGGSQCRGEQCCLRPGERCGSDSDCCLQGFEGECRIDGSGEGTCVAFCRGPDAPCTATDECCANEACIDGRCRPPGCLPTGYQCTGATDCCQTEPTVCGSGSGSRSLCCRPDRGQCAGTGDCCDDAICGNGNCCRDQGTACNTLAPDSGCCSGLDCIETGPMGQGVCSCRPVGTSCTSDLQCCVPPNQINGFCDEIRETSTCCVFRPGACATTADCCNAFRPDTAIECQAGRCCGLTGEACFADNECCSNSCCLDDDCGTLFTGECR